MKNLMMKSEETKEFMEWLQYHSKNGHPMTQSVFASVLKKIEELRTK